MRQSREWQIKISSGHLGIGKFADVLRDLANKIEAGDKGIGWREFERIVKRSGLRADPYSGKAELSYRVVKATNRKAKR